MIIEGVELENFLSHRLTRLTLGRGVIAIVGPNGAGKTSIVDAITYTLFDTHSRGNIRREQLVRLGTSRARVTVTFRVGTRLYELTKILEKGRPAQARLYLVEDGAKRLVAYGVKSVERELGTILGFDPKLASSLLVTKQGEIESILVEKNRRMELISSLLKLKAMDKAYDRIRELSKTILGKYQFYRGELKRVEDELRRVRTELAELDRLRERMAELTGNVGKLREELEKKDSALAELEERRAEYHELKTAYEKLKASIEAVEEKLKKLQEEYEEARRAAEELEEYEAKIRIAEKLRRAQELLAKVREASKAREEYEELLGQYNSAMKQLEELRGAVSEYEELRARLEELRASYEEYISIERQEAMAESELGRARERLEKLSSQVYSKLETAIPLEPPSDIGQLEKFIDGIISDVDAKIEKLQNKIREIAERRSALSRAKSDVEDVLEKLTSARGRCPLCGQPLTEEHRRRLIAKFRDERRQLEYNIQRLNEEERRVEAEIKRLKDVKAKLNQLKNEVSPLIRTIIGLRANIESLEEELKRLRQRKLELLPKYKEYLDAEQRLRQLEERVRRFTELRAYVESLEEQLTRLRERVEEAEKAREELKTILEQLSITVDDVERVSEEVSEIYMIYGELKNKASKLGQLNHEVNVAREQYEALRQKLEEVRSRLEQLEGIEERYEQTRLERESLRQKLVEAEKELAAIKAKVEVLERKRAEAERLEAEEKRLRERVERYEAAFRFVEKLKRLLSPDGIPRIVRQAAKSVLEYNLREILSAFNVEFIDVRLDDDYGVTIVSRTGEKSVGMLSGGERIALAIAYRLALARMVGSRIEAMIMDEPTIHLDAERRRELVNIIRHSLEATGLSQLIVVTHDREIEDAADTVIEVEKGREGYSVVKVQS
jgi:exonuclease SbcC